MTGYDARQTVGAGIAAQGITAPAARRRQARLPQPGVPSPVHPAARARALHARAGADTPGLGTQRALKVAGRLTSYRIMVM